MEDEKLELMKLKSQSFDMLRQIEICNMIISQNSKKIEEIEKKIFDHNNEAKS